MDLPQLMLLVSFMGTCGMLFYTVINTFLKLVGVHCHEFSTNADASQCIILMKYIKETHLVASSNHATDMPIGFIFGKWYIAYVVTVNIQKRDSVAIGYTISFWATRKGHSCVFPKDLTSVIITPTLNKSDNLCNLKVWRHDSPFKDGGRMVEQEIRFVQRPCTQQSSVVSKFVELVNISIANGFGQRLAAMIAGPSGTGKSQIARMIAVALNATICDDFNPTDAGECLATLLRITKPTHKNPLIIVLDEADQMFIDIHGQKIKEHEFLVTPVRNKPGWNTFADRLSEVDNVILIITMNKSFKEIDEMDPSYTRYGRIDFKVNFGGNDEWNPTDTKSGQFMHVHPFTNMATFTSDARFTSQKQLDGTQNLLMSGSIINVSNHITINMNVDTDNGNKPKTA